MAYADILVEKIAAAFEPLGCRSAAEPMERYMRGLFPFRGIKSPARRAAVREAIAGMARPPEDELGEAARRLWALPEREYQHTAVDLLARNAARLSPSALVLCEELITTKSWWDTVDGLAASVAGIIVLRHPETVPVMDRWVDAEDLWLRRSALIHQLKWRERTDQARLFRYCLARAAEPDFFIRKAIGWALRQYSWTNPEAVSRFVAEHEAELSPLSKREAMLAINGGRKTRPPASGRAAETD